MAKLSSKTADEIKSLLLGILEENDSIVNVKKWKSLNDLESFVKEYEEMEVKQA